MESENLLKNLNEGQIKAVTHTGGPLLIIAGAGTGKTSVITRRIAWLIAQGLAKPEEILALTFTDKAAGEMEERVDRLLPYGYVDLWIQTFHAFGERMLRTHGLDIGLSTKFRVLSRTEQWMMLRRHFEKLPLSYYKPLGNPTKFFDALLTVFSRAEDELVTPDMYLQYAKELSLFQDGEHNVEDVIKQQQEIAEVFHLYKCLLREEGALDFSDLINETLRLFQTRPHILAEYQKQFKYVLVDEFQDTNWAQYALVKLLTGARQELTVVGDDDQSIYKFRGASISNIMDFEKDFPEAARVVLTENYRSKQEILDFSYNFIQHNNPDRLEAALEGAISKRLHAAKGDGGFITHLHGKNLQDEAQLVVDRMRVLKDKNAEVTWNDFAVLVRANDHAEPFINALRIAGIPHEFYASRGLYQKPLILDVLAYLRVLMNSEDSVSFFRLCTIDTYKIPHDDLVVLSNHASKKTLSLFEAAKGASAISGMSEPGVEHLKILIDYIEKHAEETREKKVGGMVLAFLNETGYIKALAVKEEGFVREQMRVLQFFWRMVQAFADENVDPTVKNFLERIHIELEAGETGALPADPDSGPELVRLMTVHAAKGLEFRYVFIVNMVDKRFPTIERRDAIPLPDAFVKERLPGGDAHLQEERRLFYVACTRAKEGLFLTSAEEYGGVRKKKLSRFLQETDLQITGPQSTELIVDVQQVPTVKNPLPIPERMSFSQFEAFERCPLQYKFEHVYRIPKVGNANKSFGQSVHNSLQEIYKRYSERKFSLDASVSQSEKTLGALVAADEVLEIYQEKWIDEWYETKKDKAVRYEKGKEALLLYHVTHKDESPDVYGLEVGFTLKFNHVAVRGRIDRIDRLADGTVHIIDYKTGKTKEKPDKDQLFIYQLAALRSVGVKPSKLSFVYLESGSEVSFIGTDDELVALEEQVNRVADAIRASNFSPTPGDACRFCDFKNMCEFASR